MTILLKGVINLTKVYVVRELICDHPHQDEVVGSYFSEEKAEEVRGEKGFRIIETMEVE